MKYKRVWTHLMLLALAMRRRRIEAELAAEWGVADPLWWVREGWVGPATAAARDDRHMKQQMRQ